MNNEDIKIIRSSTTASLSGSSQITYVIGSLGEEQYIKLSGNSAGGLFCKEWVSLSEIKKLLKGSPKLTSKALQPLFAGRSSNSAGFLLACAIHLKLAVKDSTPADPAHETKRVKAKKTEEAS